MRAASVLGLLLLSPLAACNSRALPPSPTPVVAVVGSVPAPAAGQGLPLPPPIADAPKRPGLRWINSEGGGAGYLPVGDGDEIDDRARSFFMVGDVRGVKSVTGDHPRAALSIDADQICALTPSLVAVRARISLSISVGKPITAPGADCLKAVHPPALSFAAESRGPLSPVMTAILTRLDDCEAIGVEYAGDDIPRLLGDRASSADGRSLRSVTLTQSQISAEGIQALAKRKNLRAIGLRGMTSPKAGGIAGGSGLGALADLPDLERLDLSYGPVTDDDLAAFSSAKALRWLMLESTGIGDAGVARFAGSPDLEHIDVNFTNVGDVGLEALAGLRHVRTISLVRTSVTDRGAAALARMKSLREVRLDLTKVTDTGVEALLTLPDLGRLSVPQSVSVTAIEKWKRSHPKVRVDRYP